MSRCHRLEQRHVKATKGGVIRVADVCVYCMFKCNCLICQCSATVSTVATIQAWHLYLTNAGVAFQGTCLFHQVHTKIEPFTAPSDQNHMAHGTENFTRRFQKELDDVAWFDTTDNLYWGPLVPQLWLPVVAILKVRWLPLISRPISWPRDRSPVQSTPALQPGSHHGESNARRDPQSGYGNWEVKQRLWSATVELKLFWKNGCIQACFCYPCFVLKKVVSHFPKKPCEEQKTATWSTDRRHSKRAHHCRGNQSVFFDTAKLPVGFKLAGKVLPLIIKHCAASTSIIVSYPLVI